MTTTYTTHAYLAKIANSDEDWGSEQRPVFDVLDFVLASGDRTYFVDPSFTTANLYPQGTPASGNRRWFDTIQAAINEAELNSGTDGTQGAQIFVRPGTYTERLTIRKGMALHAWGGCGPHFYPGAQVHIEGDGTANPVIELQMSSNTIHYVSFHGFSIDNSYNAVNGTEITAAPYALHIKDKEGIASYGGAVNVYAFHDCAFRMQTWGQDNKWERGIDLECWGDVYFTGCMFAGLNYGGGNANGYIRRLMAMDGPSTSKRIGVHVDGCHFYTDDVTGTPPSDQCIFYQEDYAQLWVTKSFFNQAAVDALDQSGGSVGQVLYGWPGSPGVDDVWGQNGFGTSTIML